jgi:hypothetical protein
MNVVPRENSSAISGIAIPNSHRKKINTRQVRTIQKISLCRFVIRMWLDKSALFQDRAQQQLAETVYTVTKPVFPLTKCLSLSKKYLPSLAASLSQKFFTHCTVTQL